MNIQAQFEIESRTMHQSKAISNPKIRFLSQGVEILRITTSSANRVVIFLVKNNETVKLYPLETLNEEELNDLSIKKYIPTQELLKHILVCINDVEKYEDASNIDTHA